jgi:hypothetical protein
MCTSSAQRIAALVRTEHKNPPTKHPPPQATLLSGLQHPLQVRQQQLVRGLQLLRGLRAWRAPGRLPGGRHC